MAEKLIVLNVFGCKTLLLDFIIYLDSINQNIRLSIDYSRSSINLFGFYNH